MKIRIATILAVLVLVSTAGLLSACQKNTDDPTVHKGGGYGGAGGAGGGHGGGGAGGSGGR
ncbi:MULTISPECIES: hypothetical protein [Legionella]|uniref:Lipoprotein n=1 Tax=Legionella drozanskii LLAP-1 TaxID=1212489 RepID=A0A0W0SQY9_9GAMM|nr:MULTISPECIES: hypothetical protein [Legionella]KTC85834.1 hypothetical protein Ldro_2159 [Legionella drozanskii LLAP-1]